MYVLSRVRRFILTTFWFVAVVVGVTASASAQTARIQVIHNSPDPSVQWLSLYLNDIKVADSLLFRNAKPYVEVPAGIGIQAGFAPLNSVSPSDIFEQVTINLEADKDYVAVIYGVTDPNYRANPDGLPIGLNLLIAETRADAASPESSDYLLINCVTDAPNLDFRPRGGDPIATGIQYGSTSEYIPFDQYVYTLDVAPTEAPERILGFFDLDVGYLKDKAFTLLTSGFLNKFENGNGPELKVMVVTSEGFTQSIGLSDPTEDIATMQIINNSPDRNFLNGFDIYFNGGRAINDLRFRNATALFGLPGEATINVEVKASTGGLPIRSTTLTVEPGKNYVLMISGVVTTAQYAPNPDGEPTDLAISINPNLRLFPSQLGVGEFIFANGVPDAPMADLEITDLQDEISGVPFGEMTGYHGISEFNVLVEMVASNENLPAIITQRVELPFVLGRTFVLYAAGFMRPEKNQGGQKAQFMLALTDGAVVALRFRDVAAEGAKLQLIHASPEPSLDTADVYVDFTLVADNAPFRSATPFIDVPALKTVTVSVAAPESEGVEDASASFKMQLEEGGIYAGVINGVAEPGNFAPNPDGTPTALGLHLIDEMLESGLDGSQLTVRTANEITDAPATNVTAEYSQLIAQGVGYGEHSNYTIVPASDRFIDFTRTLQGNRVGGTYLDFDGLAGRAGILLGSGFADPAVNGNGPGFSAFLVLDDGNTIVSDRNVVSNEDDAPEIPATLRLRGNYPNPFAEATTLVFDLPEAGDVSVQIMDATGRLVQSLAIGPVSAGASRTIQLSARNLPSGMYLYTLRAASPRSTREIRGRLMLVK